MKPTTPTTEVKHTQTEKWFVDLGNYHREGDADEIIIRKEMNGELYDVCSMAYDETNFPKDHAELIVKAVNERQALLDEIKELKNKNNSLSINLTATKKLMELNEWASQETDIVSKVVVKYYYAEHMAQNGAAFLKDAARYIATRNESLNEGKTWFQLVADYAKKVDFDKTTRF